MKKVVLLLSTLLLIATSVFSQTNLPKKVVIGKDTLILISSIQLKQINVLLLERRTLKEIITDVQSKISIQNRDIVKMNQLNQDKTKLIDLQSKQIADFNSLYGLAEKNITLLQDEVKLQKKKKFKLPQILLTSVDYLFFLGWGASVTMVYIVPICYTLFQKWIYKV